MIDSTELKTRADAVSDLLREKHGLRGRTLAKRLVNGGRLLPKPVRAAGRTITEAQEKAEHPKLAVTVDEGAVDTAIVQITDHLNAIDPADRRRGKMLGWLAGQATNLLLIGAILLAVLIWRGLL